MKRLQFIVLAIFLIVFVFSWAFNILNEKKKIGIQTRNKARVSDPFSSRCFVFLKKQFLVLRSRRWSFKKISTDLNHLPLSAGATRHPPRSMSKPVGCTSLQVGDSLLFVRFISAKEEKCDFWRRTFYTPVIDVVNGNKLTARVSAASFTMQTYFSYEPINLFDQGYFFSQFSLIKENNFRQWFCRFTGGLVIYVSDDFWMKTGLEYVDGQSRLSCVVTNNGCALVSIVICDRKEPFFDFCCNQIFGLVNSDLGRQFGAHSRSQRESWQLRCGRLCWRREMDFHSQ